MKKHNALKVVLASLLVLLVLSWIFPAAYFSSEFMDQGRVQMGLFDLFEYPLTAVSYFGYIPMYLLFVGGFYGVLYKIPAYRSFLDKVAAKASKHNALTIILIVTLLAVGVSVCGLQIGFALFIPFLVSLLLLMGHDKKLVAYTLVGALAAGLVGTTYGVQNTGLATSTLLLNFDYQIGVRFVLLAVAIFLVVLNVLLTIRKQERIVVKEIKLDDNKKAEKVEEVVVEKVEEPVKKAAAKSTAKKTTTTKGAGKSAGKGTKGKGKGKSSSAKGKSTSTKTNKNTKSKNANKAALKDGDVIVAKNECECCSCLIPEEVTGTKTIWPIVTLFVLLFILMIVAFIPWGETGFNNSFFSDITDDVMKFDIFKFQIFAKLLGNVGPFGEWGINQLFLPIGLALLLLAVIYKVKFNDLLDGFVAGAKKAVVPAAIAIVAYTILVVVTYHPYQLTLYKAILGLSKGFNIATTTLVSLLATIFNVDPIYTAQSFLPYYVSVVTNADNYPIVGVIYQSIYGFASLFAPTSIILMATLSYLKVNYLDWLKTVWKLLLELFVILLIVFIILAVI